MFRGLADRAIRAATHAAKEAEEATLRELEETRTRKELEKGERSRRSSVNLTATDLRLRGSKEELWKPELYAEARRWKPHPLERPPPKPVPKPGYDYSDYALDDERRTWRMRRSG